MKQAEGYETRKVKVRGKAADAAIKIAVRVEGALLEYVAKPLAISAGKTSFRVVDAIERKIEEIRGPSFEEVLDEETVRRLALLFPLDKKATYPEIRAQFPYLSQRQCGKIRAFILENFPNRKTKEIG